MKKKAKNKRRQARKDKEARELTAVSDIAEFEHQMALDDKETNFPRHQPTESKSKRKKSGMKAPPKAPLEATTAGLNDQVDPNVDTSDDGQPKPKKMRKPLQRTETYLGFSEDVLMDEFTPKPIQKKGQVIKPSELQEIESEDEEFETPKALKLAPVTGRVVFSDSDTDVVEVVESEAELTDQEGSRKEESDIQDQQSEVDSDLQKFKSIDLVKIRNSSKTDSRKNKRAFRHKVMSEKQGLIMKGEDNVLKMSSSQTASKHLLAKAQSKASTLTTVSYTRTETGSKPKQDGAGGTGIQSTLKSASKNNTKSNTKSHTSATAGYGIGVGQLTTKSRTSATAGNGIGVGQLTHARKEIGKQLKPNAVAHAVLHLSDEDDSAKRASILQSPEKGPKRLSSTAIVKIEKPGSTSSEVRKSHAKGVILDSDTLEGWNTSVVPIFLNWFAFELDTWPTPNAVVACAQRIWDWRFGARYPLSLTKSSKHIQLLNQRLCDIRTTSASSAFINLDTEFQLALCADDDIDVSGLSQADITELRQNHASDLLADKRFIFGKYYVDRNGVAHKSRPYQSEVILRTLAAASKFIKDLKTEETNAPLPMSQYPKTLLTLATVAVERALQLTVDDDYDYAINKVKPKPDPKDPTGKPVKSMFAFNETLWESRIELYKQNISDLKSKDWDRIMKGATKYSTVLKPSSKSLKGKQHITEEEQQLEWESESSGSGSAGSDSD